MRDCKQLLPEHAFQIPINQPRAHTPQHCLPSGSRPLGVTVSLPCRPGSSPRQAWAVPMLQSALELFSLAPPKPAFPDAPVPAPEEPATRAVAAVPSPPAPPAGPEPPAQPSAGRALPPRGGGSQTLLSASAVRAADLTEVHSDHTRKTRLSLPLSLLSLLLALSLSLPTFAPSSHPPSPSLFLPPVESQQLFK